MPNASSLNVLESEVESARARLEADIARLRDPQTFSAAKDDLMREADGYRTEAVRKARMAVSERARALAEDLRARAEANPVAALAIGAGLAWRLARHPPVGGILVAAGVASLMRTQPDGLGSRTPTTDALLGARDAALERAQTVTAALSDKSQEIGDRIRRTASAAGADATALMDDARAAFAGRTAQANAHLSEARLRASRNLERPAEVAREAFEANQLYFGAAALMLGAAAGWLSRRRD